VAEEPGDRFDFSYCCTAISYYTASLQYT